jgi:hypothetical protein
MIFHYQKHTVLNYFKFIKKMPSLEAQKPSELFAEMLRVCPRGQKGNIFFINEFLSRLPKDLRLILLGMVFADRRSLADRVDELLTHTARQHHDVLAAVTEDEQAAHIAAVRGQSGQGGRANRKLPLPPPSKKAPWKGKQKSPTDQKAMDDRDTVLLPLHLHR